MVGIVVSPADQYKIENASWRDLTALHALEKLCFDLDAWPLIELLGVLTFPGLVRLRAAAEGRMVAFIAGDPRRGDQTGWILTLGVLPDWRRHGVAEALLAECETRMAMPLVKLTVRGGNAPAIRLYEKAGYQQIDIWSRYYRNGEDGLVFEKKMRLERTEESNGME